MKKVLYVGLILISFYIGSSIKASSLTTSISGTNTIYAGEQFTITLNATGTNIMGITGRLNYDSSKLTFVKGEGLNGYVATVGTNVVVDNTVGKSGIFGFVKLTFKATSSFTAGQKTTISISDVNGTDGINEIPGTGSSINISMILPKSGNNNLSKLMIDGVGIDGFNANQTSYSKTVDYNVSTINLTASPQDSKATISGVGKKTLNIYHNSFQVIAKAENGTTKTYTVNIVRKDKDGLTAPLSTNNNLKNLKIEGFNISFSSKVLEYEFDIPNNINKLDIKAEAEDSKATIKINNIDELKVNLNIITIEVKSENGDIKTYTIKVNRSADGPTTTLSEVLEVIPKTTSNVINIVINDDQNELTKEILKELKDNQIDVVLNKLDDNKRLIYSWKINSKNISKLDNIKTSINFNSDKHDKILELTNYAEGLLLSFDHSGELPKDTKVTIYVSDKYKNNDFLKLYYYNEKDDKLELVAEEIIVKDGYVELTIEHCSDYFLSKTILNDNNSVIPWIIVVFEGIIILVTLTYIYIKSIR
ncbi:MAG: cadherin-like beta sandwich domain-containing protein [Bacilli bacterium]|nr:cadherin-like beta sandwich domain-containing protein [Bacilli bacterium]